MSPQPAAQTGIAQTGLAKLASPGSRTCEQVGDLNTESVSQSQEMKR